MMNNFDYIEFSASIAESVEHLRNSGNDVMVGYADILEGLFTLPEGDFMAYVEDAEAHGISLAGYFLTTISHIEPELTVIPGILFYILGRLNNDGQPIKLVDYPPSYDIDTSPVDEIEDTFEKLAATIEKKKFLDAARPFANIMNARMPEDREAFVDSEDEFKSFLGGTIELINDSLGTFAIMWDMLPKLMLTRQFFTSCYILGRVEGCDETLAKV